MVFANGAGARARERGERTRDAFPETLESTSTIGGYREYRGTVLPVLSIDDLRMNTQYSSVLR